MTFKSVESNFGFCDVYIACSKDEAISFMRRFCESGFCVNISECEYVYKYGMESGVRIGLINYPRFPLDQDELCRHAELIGIGLSESTSQGSFTIVSPHGNKFYSRRGDL